MYTLIINTIGEVALNSDINSTLGYRYDVPLDSFGIPYIPLYEVLDAYKILGKETKMGFAFLEGYPGVLNAASKLNKILPDSISYLRKEYTNERFIEDKQYNIRTIKPGLSFVSFIQLDKNDYKRIANAILGIRSIGIKAHGITGEVEISIIHTPKNYQKNLIIDSKCHYKSLKISYLALTPICLYAPFEDGNKTLKYIPGDVILNNLCDEIYSGCNINSSDITVTNAYPSYKGQRLLPTPICASVVKLNKEEMRYRLSDGKDYSKVEQDMVLKNTFAMDYDKHVMKYTSSKITRIIINNDKVYDALQSGQIYTGYIYGSDDNIRTIAKHIMKKPFIFMGQYNDEGYGVVYRKVEEISEAEIKTENYVKRFDVLCVSDVYIINDNGMSEVSADGLLREIEYTLGVEGSLELQGKYTDVGFDYSDNLKWKEKGPVTRCIKKGSVVRVKTKKDPIDISKITHCFIGEKTNEGFGEIIAYSARDEYYRRAKELDIPLYDITFENNVRNTIIGSNVLENVVRAYAKDTIVGFAKIDKVHYKKGYKYEEIIPIELLRECRDNYLPNMKLDTIIEWYREELLSED